MPRDAPGPPKPGGPSEIILFKCFFCFTSFFKAVYSTFNCPGTPRDLQNQAGPSNINIFYMFYNIVLIKLLIAPGRPGASKTRGADPKTIIWSKENHYRFSSLFIFHMFYSTFKCIGICNDAEKTWGAPSQIIIFESVPNIFRTCFGIVLNS